MIKMNLQVFWVILVSLILLIVVAACGVFSIMSAQNLAKNSSHSSDPQLSAAYRYMIICSTLSWVTIAGLIIAVVLYFIFGSESMSVTLKYLIGAIAIVLLALCIVLGIMSAIAVSKMNDSAKFSQSSPTDLAARSKAQWVAGLALASSGLIVIGMLFFLMAKGCPKDYGAKDILNAARDQYGKLGSGSSALANKLK
jgi:flagellar basal body-associated protein FliL